LNNKTNYLKVNQQRMFTLEFPMIFISNELFIYQIKQKSIEKMYVKNSIFDYK